MSREYVTYEIVKEPATRGSRSVAKTLDFGDEKGGKKVFLADEIRADVELHISARSIVPFAIDSRATHSLRGSFMSESIGVRRAGINFGVSHQDGWSLHSSRNHKDVKTIPECRYYVILSLLHRYFGINITLFLFYLDNSRLSFP